MKLFDVANQYIEESDWKVLSALKFCLLALGMLIGMFLPEKSKKTAIAICAVVFGVTYVPLMYKFFKIACQDEEEEA